LDAYFHPFAPNTLHDIASCIKKLYSIYEVDPLTCPKCSGKMKVIKVIEDENVIKKILKHLGLWEVKPTRSMACKTPFPIQSCQTNKDGPIKH
jgi:hypothetical protein